VKPNNRWGRLILFLKSFRRLKIGSRSWRTRFSSIGKRRSALRGGWIRSPRRLRIDYSTDLKQKSGFSNLAEQDFAGANSRHGFGSHRMASLTQRPGSEPATRIRLSPRRHALCKSRQTRCGGARGTCGLGPYQCSQADIQFRENLLPRRVPVGSWSGIAPPIQQIDDGKYHMLLLSHVLRWCAASNRKEFRLNWFLEGGNFSDE
jgi:hypothetical protein